MNAEVKQLGKYSVRGELGRGAMGIVYRGFDPFIEREVAIKTLRADVLQGEERTTLLERFRKEAQAAGRLNHPGIVQVYEYGVDGDQVFIAMELIHGKELKDYIAEEARFSLADIVRIMGELLDALAFAHGHGVVHRDIKPSNIVMLQDGHIKVTDFGIARLESSTLTQAGSMLGTPSYMSPEQFMAQRVDGRSDLFSAGVMLYELLTGEKPFAGNSFATIMHKVLKEAPTPPSELNITVPPPFDALVLRALAKRPDERFQDAAAFKQALQAALAGKLPAPVMPAAALDGDATVAMRAPAPADAATVARTAAKPVDTTVVAAPQADIDATLLRAAPAAAATSVTATAASATAPARGLLAGAAVGLVALVAAVLLWWQGSTTPPAEVATTPTPSAAVESGAGVKGVVQVETDPPGAVVLIDNGRYGGVSPARLELPVGVYRMQLKKEGYHDLEASVEVVQDKEIPFQVSLTPLQ